MQPTPISREPAKYFAQLKTAAILMMRYPKTCNNHKCNISANVIIKLCNEKYSASVMTSSHKCKSFLPRSTKSEACLQCKVYSVACDGIQFFGISQSFKIVTKYTLQAAKKH